MNLTRVNYAFKNINFKNININILKFIMTVETVDFNILRSSFYTERVKAMVVKYCF